MYTIGWSVSLVLNIRYIGHFLLFFRFLLLSFLDRQNFVSVCVTLCMSSEAINSLWPVMRDVRYVINAIPHAYYS